MEPELGRVKQIQIWWHHTLLSALTYTVLSTKLGIFPTCCRDFSALKYMFVNDMFMTIFNVIT